MKNIELSDINWERLKKLAVPFEDEPNDVIGRLLDERGDEAPPVPPAVVPPLPVVPPTATIEHRTEPGRHAGRRLRKGERTPQAAYREPILRALLQMGGRGTVAQTLVRVEEQMRDTLRPVDYEMVPSGVDYRWRNTAMWERKNMIDERLLRGDSPAGTWELSEEGRRQAERLGNPGAAA